MRKEYDFSKSIPKVIILLGLVGVGKSTVGRIIQDELQGHFISIEEFFMQKYGNYENYASNRDQAYQALEERIVNSVGTDKVPVIFEEIAVSAHGKNLVDAIMKKFSTDLIYVGADLETCKARVTSRGTSRNFSKSEKVVEGAWTAFSNIKRSFKFKAEIINQNLSEQVLVDHIRKIWA